MASPKVHRMATAVCLLALACGMAFAHGEAAAQPASPAALFDEGVRKFKAAEYEAAADAFLRADAAAPNAAALLNAIAAGRRGRAHLLVAQAAQRALARADADADLKRLAREALVEVAQHLALVVLSCATVGDAPSDAAKGATKGAACSLTIDGAKVAPGAHYLLPGTHRFAGELEGGGRDEQPLTCNAGATYTVAVRPAAPSVAPSASATASAAPTAKPKEGWPPAVVYGGAGATALLLGVTVWSGVDAMEAKKALPEVPVRAQNEDVLARARRTDGLLAGTIVLAAATTATAIWLVAWDSPKGTKTTVAIAPSVAGAQVSVQGRF